MRILILGASGLAGSAIRRELKGKYETVLGTWRTKAHAPDGDPGMIRWSLEEPGRLAELLRATEPDVVVSCLRGDFGMQEEAHRIAADFLAGKPGGRMLFLSSANAFDADQTRPHFEGDRPVAQSDYGKMKVRCEELIRSRLGENGIILRPPFIWDRDCPGIRRLKESAGSKAPVQAWKNFETNHATAGQIAKWVSFILERNLRGVFHVGTEDLSDHAAFLEELARRLNLKGVVFSTEEEDTKQILAVLPGRREIPPKLRLRVEDVLRGLTGEEMCDMYR
ncbi:MAG TPA: sugar nucleotide-binding protein [Candidatus Eisenbergiella merdigallinarum]|uniref:dTDP-4-dehydrorhamnose reductase n=1 Tax=Candidatus Eisenbergiella merdigallinarum TaxID=2838552 RepID=A0A9D2MTQ4_9FIRM|nr:sugar nucleotide-binding protein [Candidatus Eisenbergiella merdigallinarum]